jgi:outer membrane lipoprotein-sorting protein
MRQEGVEGMRRKWFLLFVGLMVMFVLAACGAKTQEDVVKDLNNKLGELSSYKVNAKMTLQMGAEPQVYNVEIWHKDPSFYRVNLKNAKQDQSQMILRNNEGVFVLTPALNKSFKFQSDWPQNSSQAYLYESLITDILEDKEAKFEATKDHFVFETKTRYQNNKMLPIQEIKLNKKDLSPAEVKVMDTDRNALVKVEFSKVKFDASFDQDDFDMKKNMTFATPGVPVMSDGVSQEFAVKYPSYEIPGVSRIQEKEFDIEGGKRVILTYGGGEKSFTFIQEKAEYVQTAGSSTFVKGQPVDLGFTVGALTERSITWTQDGVDYKIASNDLTPEEFEMLARSVEVSGVK